MKKAVISKTATIPALDGDLGGAFRQTAEIITVDQFRAESSDHRPRTKVRMLYSDSGIYLSFEVDDRYVLSRHTEFNSPVCRDSCVEFFVQPKPDKGYLNFEINCGGTLLAYYIEDCRRTETGFVKSTPLTAEDAAQISIYHSMPETVDPEITEPTAWINQIFIPFCLIEKYVGELGTVEGQSWRANFYKCGDETSHPHWASWNPVTELNFHLPQCFGEIQFK